MPHLLENLLSLDPQPSNSPAVSRRSLQLAALVLALIAIAVVVAGTLTRRSEAAQLRERAQGQRVPSVVVISPGSAAAAATLELPGRIEANARAPIYARVSGYLKSWKVDIGSPVKAGQLLAEIETPDLDQQLLQARAELASAKANVALSTSTAKRWQALLADDAVSRQESDEKAGDLATKQSVVNALQANVERYLALKQFTRIVAPFDGVVTSRSTDVGALINVGGAPGSELFVVSDISKLRVYVSVPQTYVSAIRQGSKARLTVPESSGTVFDATVQSLSQAINAGSGSMLIQLAAANGQHSKDGSLLPGGFANVSFDLSNAKPGLSVPPSALLVGKAGVQVATVGADDKVVLKTVTVARDLGSVIEIASGLAADDRVIDSPPDGVTNGDAVRVMAAKSKTAVKS
jgi:RND family efflux transporter MFP subunit